jgi:hypothetical protein
MSLEQLIEAQEQKKDRRRKRLAERQQASPSDASPEPQRPAAATT